MQKRISRCAIYIRVSTAEQAMHGKSLEAQIDYLTTYAREHDMHVVGIFADEGKTARKNFKNRKAIKELLNHVKNDEVDVIIFWKMDRWFRNVSDFYMVQEILDTHNTKWIAVAEPNMNMDTREGRLNLNIMLAINQNETDTTAERIRFVNESSIRQGKVVSGAIPMGYMIQANEKGEKRVVKNPETEMILEEFFSHFLIHQSKRGTMFYLQEKYGPVITMRQIEKICKNTMYYGRYRENYNYCPPYITEDQYNKIQEVNQRNLKMYAAQDRTGEVYLFSGLIRCPLCGKFMSANRSSKDSRTGKTRKTILRNYRCPNHRFKKTCDYGKCPNESTIENYLLNHIEEAKENYLSEDELIINSVSPKISVEKKQVDKDKLIKELDRLNKMYQKGRIQEDKYDSEYDRISYEIQKLSEAPKPRVKRSYDELESILHSDWRDMYDHLTRENKRAFWRSLIKEIQLNEDNSFVKKIILI